jgi:energy-coupling factor transport system permease protein
MIFYRQGTPLLHVGIIHLSRQSLVFGVGRGLKLAELLATSVLFLSTTKVEEFTVGLARLGVPYRAGFAITLAFRLVPLFIDSALTVAQAQSLRGYDFDRGGPLERVRRYVPVIIPVFMGALRKADAMAMALEARGFGRNGSPTSFIDYPIRTSDIVFSLALMMLAAAYFLIYYLGYGAISPS